MADGVKSERTCIVENAEEKISGGKKFLVLSLVDDVGSPFEATYWRDKRLADGEADPLYDGIIALAGVGEGRRIAFYQGADANGVLNVNRDGTPKLYVNTVEGIAAANGGPRRGGGGGSAMSKDQAIRAAAAQGGLAAWASGRLNAQVTPALAVAQVERYIRDGGEVQL